MKKTEKFSKQQLEKYVSLCVELKEFKLSLKCHFFLRWVLIVVLSLLTLVFIFINPDVYKETLTALLPELITTVIIILLLFVGLYGHIKRKKLKESDREIRRKIQDYPEKYAEHIREM